MTPDGKPKESLFRYKTGFISSDIAVFSTITETVRRNDTWPPGTGVAEIEVGMVRQIQLPDGNPMDVLHDPVESTKTEKSNYSHCQWSHFSDQPLPFGFLEKVRIVKAPRFDSKN
ncbi:MAG: hypothetical protein J0L62_15280 [Bacteroidetes bacterium]|nr:hypothetical protein [Bacteroidota bacterium]